jgi:tetratricopeptide (TPR) repeat protein
MEEHIITYRRLSGEIEALFDLGNDREGSKLLAAAIQESREDQAYNLFFRSEAAGCIDGDYRKHGRLLAEANRLRPADYFLARNMGVCLLLQERQKEAVGWFQKALDQNAADFSAMRYMGLALSNQRREREAIEWYHKALVANPDDYDSMRQIGISLAKLKKDDEAVAWYRKALAAHDVDYDAMRQLGVSLASLGNYDEAIAWLNKALEINGKDAEARRNLKIITGLYAEAKGELGVARKLLRVLTRLLERYGCWLQSFVTSRSRGL